MKWSPLIAGLLAASALSVQAADLGELNLGAGSAFFGNTPVNGGEFGFVDFIRFTVTGASTLSATLSTAQNGGQDIDSFNAQLSGPGFSQQFTQVSGDPFELLGLSAFLSTPGTYTIAIGGRQNSAVLASYAGTVGISAVPEPGTLATMLAGVAVLAAIAKRRAAAG